MTINNLLDSQFFIGSRVSRFLNFRKFLNIYTEIDYIF